MADVRTASARDAEELVRLRAIMLGSMDGVEVPLGPWSAAATATLRERLAAAVPTMAAFVVDRPDEPGRLACCVVGTIEYRLGGPKRPNGDVGYVFNVSTDPGYRRRGYARSCMEALLDWFAERGVATVDLKASPDGAPLYESLGFRRTPDPAMRLSR